MSSLTQGTEICFSSQGGDSVSFFTKLYKILYDISIKLCRDINSLIVCSSVYGTF